MLFYLEMGLTIRQQHHMRVYPESKRGGSFEFQAASIPIHITIAVKCFAYLGIKKYKAAKQFGYKSEYNHFYGISRCWISRNCTC